MNYSEDWAEIISFTLLIVGFFMSLVTGSTMITYVMAVLFGIMAGRFWFQRRKDKKAPYFLIISGFVIGYTAGAYHGNRVLTFLILIISALASNYLHKNKLF